MSGANDMKPTARTSETHPLLVDFAPLPHRVRGRIGMTLAPGKHDPVAATGAWSRDLDIDLMRLRDPFGADVLVTLLEEHEFELLCIPDLRRRAEALGIESLWLPMPDSYVPRSMAELGELVHDIVDHLRQGETVVVHCRGGLGRTGLVVASVLISFGIKPAAAISTVRAARPGAVENQAQERFIDDYATWLHERRR